MLLAHAFGQRHEPAIPLSLLVVGAVAIASFVVVVLPWLIAQSLAPETQAYGEGARATSTVMATVLARD